jgi:hypothetical protein
MIWIIIVDVDVDLQPYFHFLHLVLPVMAFSSCISIFTEDS